MKWKKFLSVVGPTIACISPPHSSLSLGIVRHSPAGTPHTANRKITTHDSPKICHSSPRRRSERFLIGSDLNAVFSVVDLRWVSAVSDGSHFLVDEQFEASDFRSRYFCWGDCWFQECWMRQSIWRFWELLRLIYLRRRFVAFGSLSDVIRLWPCDDGGA